MIETFTYISEPYEKLMVKSINYGYLLEAYPKFNQNQLYRGINSACLNMIYTLFDNNIIFCYNDNDSHILSKISKVFINIGIVEKDACALKIENRELTFDENNKIIFYRLIRESIMNQYSGGCRDRYGISYDIKDISIVSKIKKHLVINISGQIICNSTVMVIIIIDLRYKNLGLNNSKFKNISVVDPRTRYLNIKNKVIEIFGDYDKFKINVIGNKEIVLKRVKV